MTVPLLLSSVPATAPYIQYVATNLQTVFPYPFPITQDADLIVVVNGVTLATDAGYTLSGQGDSTGGNLTFTLGQSAGAIVTLYRQIAIQRITQIGQNSGFSSTAFNAEYNQIYLILQQLQEANAFTLQVPSTNTSVAGTTLLTPAAYANKYLSFDGNGNPTPAVLTSSGSLTGAIIAGLLSLVTGSPPTADKVRSAAEITAGVTPTNYSWPVGDVRRYGAVADGSTDSTTAIQNAVTVAAVNSGPVYFPAGASWYKITTAISVTAAVTIYGDNVSTMIRAFNCNAFNIAAGVNTVTIRSIQLFSVDAGGGADPRTMTGIQCAGTTGSHNNYIVTRDLYLRGWNICIDWQYTWGSVIDNVNTINCNYGVRLYGQSVNNYIGNSDLLANSGTASIKCQKNVAEQGEGLMIVNTLLASGTSGLISDGFLEIVIANCTIDQVTGTGLDLTNCVASAVTNSWIYATNFGINMQDLGVAVDQQITIAGCRIQATGANGKAVRVGANNTGVSLTGGTLISGPSGTARCLYTESAAGDVCAVGVHMVNNNTGTPATFIGGSGFRTNGNTGDQTIQYNAPDSYTGTLTQCTTAPTATIVYSVSGDLVTLVIPSLTATSGNTNAPTITGMPAAIRPLTAQWIAGSVIDNTTAKIGLITVETSGVLTIYNATSSTFTSSGTKGANFNTITYRKN